MVVDKNRKMYCPVFHGFLMQIILQMVWSPYQYTELIFTAGSERGVLFIVYVVHVCTGAAERGAQVPFSLPRGEL